MAFATECQRFFFTVRHGAQLAQILTNLALSGGTGENDGVQNCKTKALLYQKLASGNCNQCNGTDKLMHKFLYIFRFEIILVSIFISFCFQ